MHSLFYRKSPEILYRSKKKKIMLISNSSLGLNNIVMYTNLYIIHINSFKYKYVNGHRV